MRFADHPGVSYLYMPDLEAARRSVTEAMRNLEDARETLARARAMETKVRQMLLPANPEVQEVPPSTAQAAAPTLEIQADGR
jgi:hypothetical protein